MNILLIIFVVAIVAFVAKTRLFGRHPSDNSSRPIIATKPNEKSPNDKVIVVNNVNHADISSVLIKFCNLYNQGTYAALPRLTQISSTSFAVTFPYDIDFITFCFAVNFLKYPMDIKWDSDVKAWATTQNSDEWVTDEIASKKVMLYLTNDDKEYDNVFLTSSDNIGYKLDFAGKQKQLSGLPPKSYSAPLVDIHKLEEAQFEDFQ